MGLFQKISAKVHAKCTNQPTKANRPARRWLEAVAGPDTVTRRASALARSTVETREETHPSVKIPSLHIEDLIFCRQKARKKLKGKEGHGAQFHYGAKALLKLNYFPPHQLYLPTFVISKKCHKIDLVKNQINSTIFRASKKNNIQLFMTTKYVLFFQKLSDPIV